MRKKKNQPKIVVGDGDLFDRIVSILNQARSNVIKSVNSNMVLAYWLIGKEIVQEIQKGENRAEYGKKVIEGLADKLSKRFGRGFSSTNLRYFRQFHTVYADRMPQIRHIQGGEFEAEIIRPIHHTQSGVLADISAAVEKKEAELGLSPQLGWSHYRELMHVENRNERLFYEIEAEKEQWDVDHLKRQIHTFLFARLLKSKDKAGVLELTRKGLEFKQPSDLIKSPYILDFLGLSESDKIYESNIEKAIIDNLQSFLLELGKGFAFVARQKRVSTEHSEFYIDLVFYNYHLKCFVLIDLKIGKLIHQDVGQMDMYVRMFDDLERGKGDNPTVGLILCAEKDKTVVKYSVLNENKQLFAAKYMLYLPSEEELAKELDRKKSIIEMEMRNSQ